MPRPTTAPADPPGAWGQLAACADRRVPWEVRAAFTTDRATEFETDALALCAGCPSRAACAGYAASRQQSTLAGVWAGRRYRVQPDAA